MCWAIVRRLTVLEVRAGCQTLGRGGDDHFLIINEFIINIDLISKSTWAFIKALKDYFWEQFSILFSAFSLFSRFRTAILIRLSRVVLASWVKLN